MTLPLVSTPQAAPHFCLANLFATRLFDRVLQLESALPDLNTERVIRSQQVYGGSVHDVPPWEGVIKDQEKFREEKRRMIIAEGVN